MAYIEPRKNKKGEITSYRIIVSDGMDLDGKQIRRIMTWKPNLKSRSNTAISLIPSRRWRSTSNMYWI